MDKNTLIIEFFNGDVLTIVAPERFSKISQSEIQKELKVIFNFNNVKSWAIQKELGF